jgi:hypothetical protein
LEDFRFEERIDFSSLRVTWRSRLEGDAHLIRISIGDQIFWGQYQGRPLEGRVQDIRQENVKKIFFIDDKILGNRGYAREFFKAFTLLKLGAANTLDK